MTQYFKDLHDAIVAYGGMFNSHLHLDRAGTYHATVDILRDQGVKDGTVLLGPTSKRRVVNVSPARVKLTAQCGTLAQPRK